MKYNKDQDFFLKKEAKYCSFKVYKELCLKFYMYCVESVDCFL